MYLRETKQRRADGSSVTYLQLAENVWDGVRRRSQARIIYNCGRADDPEVTERLRRLAKSILRRCSPEEILAAGPGWRLVCAWPYGDVYILEQIWKRLGIDAILREQARGRSSCTNSIAPWILWRPTRRRSSRRSSSGWPTFSPSMWR